MRASEIRIETANGQAQLSATVSSSALQEPFYLWYRVPEAFGEYLSDSGDSFVALLWPLACTLGEDLTVDAPVSPELRAALPRITEIFACWGGDEHPFQQVRLFALDRTRKLRRPVARTASFFSLGVDSTYTLIKHARTLDHLIIIRSFDRWPWDDPYCVQVLAATNDLLSHLDARPSVILLDTNARALSDHWLSWRHLMHGAGLAAAAHALSGGLGTCFIAATHSYRHLHPLGSHPLLDPLWSSAAMQIVHDGAEIGRLRKIFRLAQTPFAVRHLRVCNAPIPGRFNCGCCNKCLRTMVTLHLAGVLDKCETLPARLDLGALRNMRPEGVGDRIWLEEIQEQLCRPGADPALREAFEGALRSRELSRHVADVVTLLLQAAREKVNAGDYAGAIPYLEKVQHLAPNSPEAPYLWGYCLLRQRQRLEHALTLLDTALARGFTEFWVRYARASLYPLLGRLPEALEDARGAAELDPTHTGARELLHWLESLQP